MRLVFLTLVLFTGFIYFAACDKKTIPSAPPPSDIQGYMNCYNKSPWDSLSLIVHTVGIWRLQQVYSGWTNTTTKPDSLDELQFNADYTVVMTRNGRQIFISTWKISSAYNPPYRQLDIAGQGSQDLLFCENTMLLSSLPVDGPANEYIRIK